MTKFYKVSKTEFIKDYIDIYGNVSDEIVKKIYDNIIIPCRATKYSAGYDFYAPYSFSLEPNNEILIPTGIRVQMNTSQVLLIFPRSSLGFKFKLRLNNTIGVIDSDYFNSDNEGHIFVKITNESKNKTLSINQGSAFCQGIFIEYGLTDDDMTTAIRKGGIGSTNEN